MLDRNLVILIITAIATILFVFLILTYRVNSNKENPELATRGFLGKKLNVLSLIVILVISTLGISYQLTQVQFDERTQASETDNLSIVFEKNENTEQITGYYKNVSDKLVEFSWEIKVFGEESYNLSEKKEFRSKISIINPKYPISVKLTIKSENGEVLESKSISISI